MGANDKLTRWLSFSTVKVRSALRKVKKRWIILSIAFVSPAFATQPSCTATSTGGVVFACPNTSYDGIIPTGQTYARWIALNAYPTGQQASSTLCIIKLGPGKGWVEQTTIATLQAPLAKSLALYTTPACPGGFSVFAFYTSSASGAQVVAAHSIGDTSLTIEPIGNSGGNLWWPNLSAATCTVDGGCLGINPPFTAIYKDPDGSNSETVTITLQTGNGLINTITGGGPGGGLQFNHAANGYIFLPKTQFPASIADDEASDNWLGTNAGQGTYPGNPQKIYKLQVSSDAHIGLMTTLLPHGECLLSCSILSSWWGSSVGNNGGSSQTLSSWNILSFAGVGVPWSIPYEFTNGFSGGGNPGAVQSVVTSLMGCRSGVETGCAAALTAASPLAYLPTTTYTGPIISATGTFDATTPCVLSGTSLPFTNCATGNQYEQSGRDYVLWGGGGSGHGGDCNGVQATVNFTGTATAGSSTMLVSNTTGLQAGAPNGMTLGGPGIPFDTVIGSITANTSITLKNSNNTLVNATQTGTFGFVGAGQCYPYWQNALNGFAGGNAVISGTASVGGTTAIQ